MSQTYLNMINEQTEKKPIPIWMMRQAGRYLPEYRDIRKNSSFLEMVYTPEIATEITLQPIRRFGFDAAILFSDILVTPQALGMALTFTSGVGPQFLDPIRSIDDINQLKSNESYLNPIYETVRQVRASLPEKTTLIGFAGAPFTVASYMIEGGSSKDLKKTKVMMVTEPKLFSGLLDKVTEVTINYLEQQVIAGAQALQIFDTWINHLDWYSCEQYSANYVQKIVTELRARKVDVPITFFGKQTSVFFPLFQSTGVNVISFDWNGNLSRIDSQLAPEIGIQGNLDPFILYGPNDLMVNRVKDICQSVTSGRPFIFNLGHGLMPDIPIDSVQNVIDTVRSVEF
ncbi:MAG: uroporphyrinogen decarboxylase [Candidatus Margulisiibacteriota bacterium]